MWDYLLLLHQFLKDMNFKRFYLILCILVVDVFLFSHNSLAQDNGFNINTLRLEARADFDYFSVNDSSYSGLRGKFINFVFSGQINEKFSYNYRQRINIANIGGSKTFFQGTDWMYLTYHASKNFSFSAGKQCLGVGGWEYDLPPIDVYFASEFWDKFNCYEITASASFTDNSKNNTLTFQFSNSPFITEPLQSLYGYNLIWYGKMGFFKTSYSLNMFEYRKDHYISYIALGNAFDFGDFTCYLDFMNRAHGDQYRYFFSDMTVIAEAKYKFAEKWSVFAKGGYDINEAQDVDTPIDEYYDLAVLPGTDCYFYGIGGEFFPLKGKNDIRIHSFFAVKTNDVTTCQFNLGLTWRINFKQN